MPTTPSNPYRLAEEQYASLVSRLQSAESRGMEHGELEELIRVKGNELLRRLFQSHLDERYEAESAQVNVVGEDGVKRPHRRNRCQRQLATLFGEVVVSRLGYSSKSADVGALSTGQNLEIVIRKGFHRNSKKTNMKPYAPGYRITSHFTAPSRLARGTPHLSGPLSHRPVSGQNR